MKSLSYIVLALALGCGGNSSSGNHGDSSRPCPDMEHKYDDSSGKNNGRDTGRDEDYDMNDTRDDMHPDSSAPDYGRDCPDMVSARDDMGLEGRLDAGVDSGIDLGREPDMGADAGRCPPREIIYPFADLVCEAPDCRVNEDCLYEFSLRRDRTFCWDFSPSMAGPGRVIETYRFYPDMIGFPEFYIGDPSPPDACFVYASSQRYNARLEVVDDLGRLGILDLYNNVGD